MARPACMIVVASVAILGLEPGCGPAPSPPRPEVPKPAASAKEFALKGVVRKVNAGTGEVTIAHEAIPGFMPSMTMPFTLKDKASLEDIRPGDAVAGRLAVTFEGDEVKNVNLSGLEVTKSANSTFVLPTEAPAPAPLNPGEVVPDFAVTTQDGQTLRLSDLRGEVVILTFIYTRCPLPEFCPAMDAKFADLARRISAVPGRSEQIRLLSVSFDPEHDTPEVLTAHASRRGAKPPLWTFAVASHDELAKVAGPLGLSYIPGTGEISHNLRTAFIGPDGKLVRLEAGPGWSTSELFKVLVALIPRPRKA